MTTYTDYIYTKREAEEKARELQNQHGGKWEVERARTKNGQRWCAVQTASRRAVERQQALQSAKMYLDPDFSPFSQKDGVGRRLGYYAQRDRLKAKLDEFTAKFSESPLYELKWSTPVIEAAAEYNLVCQIIAAHERGVPFEEILRTVEREADRKNGSLSRSTSPMSNLCEDAERIAHGKIAKQMRSWHDAFAKAKGDLWAYGEGLA